MKRLIFLFLLIPAWALAQGPVELKITFKPFKNQYVYLGYHLGKQKPIMDSILLDANSQAVYKRNIPLEKGVYLLGFPDKSGFFEFLVDKEQQFSIYADSARLLESLKFTGSPDNELFLDYQRFSSVRGRQIETLKKELASKKTRADSAVTEAMIRKLGEELQQYRDNLVTSKPDATISALLLAMKEPVIPPGNEHPGGKYDSLYAYRYFKDHYWDNTYFFDDRLVRTTFFEEKLDEYFTSLVIPDPDSVIKELDWMLGYASVSPEMQKFLLIKFVNRYLNQKYMWEDRVFVYLFEKYFSQKDYPWLNEKGKKTIFDRAYSLMANLFGSQASDIEGPDTLGRKQSLFTINNPYTVVVFWDPTCGHCKETLPKMDSVYRAQWKEHDIKIFAVAKESEGNRDTWKQFIRDHNLLDWTHVYYSRADEKARTDKNIPGYLQLYDVQTVPTIYLLDKDKRIIAKKIPLEQIEEVIRFKLKKS